MNALVYYVVDDVYFKVAFNDKLDGLNRRSLRLETRDFSKTLMKKLFSQARGVRCLIFDGGTDVSGNKLIAIGLSDGRAACLLDMINTELQTLDKEFYYKILAEQIQQLEDEEIFVAAVVLDNEASPNSGVKKLLREKLPHLIHFRCGCHTIELLLQNILNSHSSFRQQISLCETFVLAVKNSKEMKKSFQALQTTINSGSHIYSLILPNNTRKWSGVFLMICRILLLKDSIKLLIKKEGLQKLNWIILTSLQEVRFFLCFFFFFFFVPLISSRFRSPFTTVNKYYRKIRPHQYMPHISGSNFICRHCRLQTNYRVMQKSDCYNKLRDTTKK